MCVDVDCLSHNLDHVVILQILAVCMSMGTTIDAEEERALMHDINDSEVTMSAIAALTVDCLATFVPAKYVPALFVAVVLVRDLFVIAGTSSGSCSALPCQRYLMQTGMYGAPASCS